MADAARTRDFGAHEAWAEQDEHRRGWLARYQTDRGVRTVTGRWARRCALLFGNEQEAIHAAQKALIAHLVANPRPRSSGAKTFEVSRSGRHARTIHLPRA